MVPSFGGNPVLFEREVSEGSAMKAVVGWSSLNMCVRVGFLHIISLIYSECRTPPPQPVTFNGWSNPIIYFSETHLQC